MWTKGYGRNLPVWMGSWSWKSHKSCGLCRLKGWGSRSHESAEEVGCCREQMQREERHGGKVRAWGPLGDGESCPPKHPEITHLLFIQVDHTPTNRYLILLISNHTRLFWTFHPMNRPKKLPWARTSSSERREMRLRKLDLGLVTELTFSPPIPG